MPSSMVSTDMCAREPANIAIQFCPSVQFSKVCSAAPRQPEEFVPHSTALHAVYFSYCTVLCTPLYRAEYYDAATVLLSPDLLADKPRLYLLADITEKEGSMSRAGVSRGAAS